jgi:hypothetical protein
MFPYEHLRGFMAALVDPPEEASRSIAEAISHSEGLRAAAGTGILAVRVAQQLDAQDRSFITHRSEDFLLEVINPGEVSRYIEHLPDLLRFRHHAAAQLALDIDVDLWEALMRMRAGFTPSREDLRGSWLSLQTFKEKVASTPSRELLIQPEAAPLMRVHVDDEGRIVTGVVT